MSAAAIQKDIAARHQRGHNDRFKRAGHLHQTISLSFIIQILFQSTVLMLTQAILAKRKFEVARGAVEYQGLNKKAKTDNIKTQAGEDFPHFQPVLLLLVEAEKTHIQAENEKIRAEAARQHAERLEEAKTAASEIARLRDAIKNLQNDNETLEEQKKQAEIKAETDAQEAEEKIRQLSEKSNDLKNEKDKINETYVELHNRVDNKLVPAGRNLEAQVEVLKSENTTLQHEKAGLQEKNTDNEIRISKLCTAGSMLENKVAYQDRKINDLTTAHNELQVRSTNSDNTRDELQGRLTRTETAHSSLQCRLTDSERTSGELQCRLTVSEKTCGELQRSLTRVESHNDELQRELNDAKRTHGQLQGRLSSLEAACKSVGDGNKRMQAQNRKLVKKYETLKSAHTQMNIKNEKLEAEKKELKQRVNRLEWEKNCVAKELGQLKDKVNGNFVAFDDDDDDEDVEMDATKKLHNRVKRLEGTLTSRDGQLKGMRDAYFHGIRQRHVTGGLAMQYQQLLSKYPRMYEANDTESDVSERRVAEQEASQFLDNFALPHALKDTYATPVTPQSDGSEGPYPTSDASPSDGSEETPSAPSCIGNRQASRRKQKPESAVDRAKHTHNLKRIITEFEYKPGLGKSILTKTSAERKSAYLAKQAEQSYPVEKLTNRISKDFLNDNGWDKHVPGNELTLPDYVSDEEL